MHRSIIPALALFASCAPALAVQYEVFFAGGQSNATPIWAAGIEARLQELYDDPNVEVEIVYNIHSGSSINVWHTWDGDMVDPGGAVRKNYRDGGTVLAPGPGDWNELSTEITNLVNSIGPSDSVNFRGWFWFQGEGDVEIVDVEPPGGLGPGPNTTYNWQFAALMNTLQSDLETLEASLGYDFHSKDNVDFLMTLIQANPDSSHDMGNMGDNPDFRGDVDFIRALQQLTVDSLPGGVALDSDSLAYPFESIFSLWHREGYNGGGGDGNPTIYDQLGRDSADAFFNAILPEPSSALLALLGLPLLLRRRR